MAKRIAFQFAALPENFKLNGGLKEPVRFSEKRAVFVEATNRFHADFDGDGQQDRFILNIKRGPRNLQCSARNNQCVLFLPNGAKSVAKLIPGYASGNNPADFYLETTDGEKTLLQHKMQKPLLAKRTEADYAKHLANVSKLAQKNWDAAVAESIRYNLGLPHTWIVQKTSTDPLTWINAEKPYTDCTFELERVIAELRSDGSLENFKEVFRNVQYYPYQGQAERADFTTAEALPHYKRLGVMLDETERLFTNLTGTAAPTFSAKIDKEAWYKAQHDGAASGKNFSPQQLELAFIPFATAVSVNNAGEMHINPKLAEVLPKVSVAIVMNKDRRFEKLGTDIPESHIIFLVKEGKSIKVLHSTPTTDLGIAAVTMEDFDVFMKSRYVKVENGVVVSNGKEKTAVGFKVLFFAQPAPK